MNLDSLKNLKSSEGSYKQGVLKLQEKASMEEKQKRRLVRRINALESKQAKRWNKDRQSCINKMKFQLTNGLSRLLRVAEINDTKGKFNIQVTSNQCEHDFFEAARKAGWTPSKRGWPDFIMWKDGKIACVEVKTERAPLRDNQKAVMSALNSFGIPCYVWRPISGFERFNPQNPEKLFRKAIFQEAEPRKFPSSQL